MNDEKERKETSPCYRCSLMSSDISLEREIIQGQTEGLRARGRPPTSWMDDMRALTGGTVVEATGLACNRVVWRALVLAKPARVRLVTDRLSSYAAD